MALRARARKLRGQKHLWVLNSAHRKVCLNCGMNVKVTSFYRFAADVGLLGFGEGDQLVSMH